MSLIENEFDIPGLDSYQYSNNTIILFATQYKNDNPAFHRGSAVSGGLALWRAFCQWKIEHQVRKSYEKGLTGGIRVLCLPNFFVFHQTLLYPKWFCDFYLQTVTDLRIGQIGHGLGSRAFGVPRNSFLWRLIIKLKFGKLRRGITSQFTLKRAKMQMSRPHASNWWPAGQMWPARSSYVSR